MKKPLKNKAEKPVKKSTKKVTTSSKKKPLAKKKKAKKKAKKKTTKKAMIPDGWLSMSEFCDIIKASPSGVRYACTRGRITSCKKYGIKGRYFDPIAAPKEWEENVDHIQRAKNNKVRSDPSDPETLKKYLEQKKEEIAHFSKMDFDKITSTEAERREKVYKAKLAEIKFLEQSGKLIELELIKSEWFELVRKVRDSLETIPARLAPELASETNSHKIERRIVKEINDSLQKLVDENASR